MKTKLKFALLRWRNAIYVGIVTTIIGYLLVRGGWLVFGGEEYIRGVVMFLLGAVFCAGYKTPNDSPTTVWLLTFLGKKTTIVVRRVSYLIPWIVDKVEFPLLRKDHNFQMKKPIRCYDGSYLPMEGNFISALVAPDDKDSDTQTAGQKLFELDDVGGLDGAIRIMDDLFTVMIEKIANEEWVTVNGVRYRMSSLWMETHGLEVSQDVRPRLLGLPVPPEHSLLSASVAKDLDAQDDVRGTGITFEKFAPVFSRSAKIIEMANEVDVEREQRKVEFLDRETMEKRVEERIAAWRKVNQQNGVKDPVFPGYEYFRGQLIEETLLKDHKYTKIVNQGGTNVAVVPTPTAAPVAGTTAPTAGGTI